jgi:hypothetical protein
MIWGTADLPLEIEGKATGGQDSGGSFCCCVFVVFCVCVCVNVLLANRLGYVATDHVTM